MEMINYTDTYQDWKLDFNDIINGRISQLTDNLQRTNTAYEILGENTIRIFCHFPEFKRFECREDDKDSHDWYHIISAGSGKDHSFDLYKCRECGAILLRKWGHEMIITCDSKDGFNQLQLCDIANGLEYDETWGQWKPID